MHTPRTSPGGESLQREQLFWDTNRVGFKFGPEGGLQYQIIVSMKNGKPQLTLNSKWRGDHTFWGEGGSKIDLTEIEGVAGEDCSDFNFSTIIPEFLGRWMSEPRNIQITYTYGSISMAFVWNPQAATLDLVPVMRNRFGEVMDQ